MTPLAGFLERHRRLLVLTGAGVSTDSGIPDYRNPDGTWKHHRPIEYREFVGSAATRRRYWARSLVGWRRIHAALPNLAHEALARLEAAGRVGLLVTQNVDGLHQRAGQRSVVDLHGRLDRVECLGCKLRYPRDKFQAELARRNPGWGEDGREQTVRPDGDVDLGRVDYEHFDVPDCPSCGGVLKPWVVFFGEAVPRPRVDRTFGALAQADALLVVGSSLMVFSGYRFVREAAKRGIPTAAVNLGKTRADDLLTLKVEAPCAEALPAAVGALA